MVERSYEVGEIREFVYEVKSSQIETVVISSARWRMLDRDGAECSSGVCTVENHRITMVIPMTAAGVYILELTAVIPPETIIERTEIKVVT